MSVKGLLMALVLITSNSAFAATILKENLTITGLYNLPSGGFLIITPGGMDAACGPSGNLFHVYTQSDDPHGIPVDGAKAALAIALTAFTLAKTVNIYYDNTISGCPVSMVWIGGE